MKAWMKSIMKCPVPCATGSLWLWIPDWWPLLGLYQTTLLVISF